MVFIDFFFFLDIKITLKIYLLGHLEKYFSSFLYGQLKNILNPFYYKSQAILLIIMTKPYNLFARVLKRYLQGSKKERVRLVLI